MDQETPPERLRTKAAKPTRSVSISTALTASIGLLVLVALAVVLAVQWRTNVRNTLELMNEKAVQIASTIEQGVTDHLEPALAQADYIAGLVGRGELDLTNELAIEAYLRGSLAAAPQVAGAVVVSPDLMQTMIWQGAGRQPEIEIADGHGVPGLEEAIAEMAKTDRTFWGELVFNRGETLVNLRRTLRKEGQIVGFYFAAVTTADLSELVTEIGDTFDATAFILYGKDRVLAHPILIEKHPEQGPDSPTVVLDHLGDIVLAALPEGEIMRGFKDADAEGVEVVRYEVGEVEYIAIYKWIDRYGATPWALGAWFIQSDLDEQFRRLQMSGLFGLAALAVAILAALVLGHLLAGPIRRVALGAARVGELDLDEVGLLPASRVRELNDQARSFNAMLTSLRAFETYVPKSLVKQLIRAGAQRSVAPEEVNLTVMFTDIAGFTAMVERLPAADVAEFLNHHFKLLCACVEAEGGTIDKFIGDALMAFWGAPEHQSDTALRACRAAVAMQRAIDGDNAARAAQGEPPIRIRIGIHTGPLVVGNIGAPGRINYTVVGDTVNSAQRLERLGKELSRGDDTTILISDATAAQLDDSFDLEAAGEFTVRGREDPIKVYRLTAHTP